MSNLIPQKMTYEELGDLLEDIARRARAGDSDEGNIEYLMSDEGDVEVRGVYRIGNLQGQGGIRMIGTVPGIEQT
jgi:hypothetical protein